MDIRATIEGYGSSAIAKQIAAITRQECRASTVDYWRAENRLPHWRAAEFWAAVRKLEKSGKPKKRRTA